MRLEYTCSGCKEQNNYTPVVPTRGDLQMKGGDEVHISCTYCGKMDNKHINRIDAVVDNKKIMIAIGVSAIVTIVLYSIWGLIGTITASIPLLIWVQESKSTNHFNSYKIRRR